MKTIFHSGNATISSPHCRPDSNATSYAENGLVEAVIVFCGWADMNHAPQCPSSTQDLNTSGLTTSQAMLVTPVTTPV